MKPSRLRTLLPALVVLAGALVIFGVAALRRSASSAATSAADAGAPDAGVRPFFALGIISATGAAPGYHPVPIPNGQPVFVSDAAVVSNFDVKAARAVMGPAGGSVVELDWTPEARARLKQETSVPGRSFALVIDDHFEMLLTFNQPVDEATTRLDRGPVALDVAQSFANRFVRPPAAR